MRRLAILPGPYTYALAIDGAEVTGILRHEVGAITDGKRLAGPGDHAALLEALAAMLPVDDIALAATRGAPFSRAISDAITAAYPAARIIGEWRSKATGDEWTHLAGWPAGELHAGYQDAAALLALSPPGPRPAPAEAHETRAGIDPGSAAVGVAIASGHAVPLRLVLARSIPIGEVVQLAKPREVAGGQVRTTRRSLTGEHVAAVAREVRDLCVAHGVTRAIVEHAESVYLPGDAPRSHQSIATAMSKTEWVGGAISTLLRDAGISVEEVPRPTWRARVLPKRKGSAGDGNEALPGVIAEAYPGWSGDEHARDAAGALLWDVLGEKPRAPRASKRAGTACTCASAKGRHVLGCPLATAETGPRKPRRVWTWENARGLLG